MSFLPQNYEPPATGNYMKFATGKNKFRVLGSAIVGMVFWTGGGKDRKPVRRRMDEDIQQSELELNQRGEVERPKHFWAFPVWNYSAKQVQILEITQKTVRDGITTLVEDSDWGEPTDYDITVTKKGESLDTEYHVMPSERKPVEPAIVEAYRAMNLDLDVLYIGGDPFGGSAAAPAGGNGAKPTASGVTPNIAQMKAWNTFRLVHRGKAEDGIRNLWVKSFREYFDGRSKDTVTVEEWGRFELDAFVKPQLVGAGADAGDMPPF